MLLALRKRYLRIMKNKDLKKEIEDLKSDFDKKITDIQLEHKKRIQIILDKIELRKIRKNI